MDKKMRVIVKMKKQQKNKSTNKKITKPMKTNSSNKKIMEKNIN